MMSFQNHRLLTLVSGRRRKLLNVVRNRKKRAVFIIYRPKAFRPTDLRLEMSQPVALAGSGSMEPSSLTG